MERDIMKEGWTAGCLKYPSGKYGAILIERHDRIYMGPVMWETSSGAIMHAFKSLDDEGYNNWHSHKVV